MSTKLNAFPNPFQTSYQPHTAHLIGTSANLPSLSSVPSVNPITHLAVTTQSFTLPFNGMNSSVNICVGIDYQNTTIPSK